MRCALERIHLINPLSGKTSFTEKILVHVRNGCRIGIDAGMPRVDRGEARTLRTAYGYLHARLQDAIAFGDSSECGVEVTTIEWMRQRTDE